MLRISLKKELYHLTNKRILNKSKSQHTQLERIAASEVILLACYT